MKSYSVQDLLLLLLCGLFDGDGQWNLVCLHGGISSVLKRCIYSAQEIFILHVQNFYTNSRADWPLPLSSFPSPSSTLAFQQYKNTALCLSTLLSGSLGEASAGTWNHPFAWSLNFSPVCRRTSLHPACAASWDVENSGLMDVLKDEGNQMNSIFWWTFSHSASEEQKKKKIFFLIRTSWGGTLGTG